MASGRPDLRILDERRAAVLEQLCETIVPGSARVGPVVYIDAILAGMPEGQREVALASIDSLEPMAGGGREALEQVAATPEFQMVRAMAVEAFYSDFVAPGAPGPGAWEEIDFVFPLASRYEKDWSYLGISG
jgi:hypothetical protein